MTQEYVRSLDRALAGPARLKTDLLREARDSLADATEGYRAAGLGLADAEQRAIAEFGPVRLVATAYQRELAAATVRTLTLRVIAVTVTFTSGAGLMSRGAPWTGPEPSLGYRLLSGSLDWVWVGCGVISVASYLWLTWASRRGPPASARAVRVAGRGIASVLGLAWVGGIVIYVWSLRLWDAALTWPPMIVGLVAVAGAYAWLAAGVRGCLAATR